MSLRDRTAPVPPRLCRTIACAAALALGPSCSSEPPSSGASGAPAASSPSVFPEETWSVIRADRAPILDDPTSVLPPAVVLSAGDVVQVQGPAGDARWRGDRPGEHFERDGALLRVILSARGAPRLVFASDVGGEVKVPRSSAICAHLDGAGLDLRGCEAELQRALLPDGRLVAWAPCTEGRCPVVVLTPPSKAEVYATGVAGLTEARVLRGKKRSVLLALTRYVRDNGTHTGAAWSVLPLEKGPLVVEREVPTEEIDARDPERIKNRLLESHVANGVLRLTGQSDVKRPDGTVLSSEKIDETVDLGLGD